MNDEHLTRALNSIGKTCFVKYFTQFSNPTLSDERVARILVRREGWAYTSALHRRTREARRIIDAGRAKDALMQVIDSPSPIITTEVKSRARSLLDS